MHSAYCSEQFFEASKAKGTEADEKLLTESKELEKKCRQLKAYLAKSKKTQPLDDSSEEEEKPEQVDAAKKRKTLIEQASA